MGYPAPDLTAKERYKLMRVALGGEQVLTPIEAYIFNGGDPDDFTPEIRRKVEHDLMILSYKKETVSFGVYGEPAERWVRRDDWMEDEEWRDPSPFDFSDVLAAVKRQYALP